MGIPRGLVSMKPTVTVSLGTNILLCKRIFILTKRIVEMDFNCILVNFRSKKQNGIEMLEKYPAS